MKLNEIKRRCLEQRLFLLADAPDGGQWLADGYNCWRVFGLVLNEDCLRELFGLTEKQACKCLFTRKTMSGIYNGENYSGREESLRQLGDVWAFDQLYMALQGSFGMILVPHSALKPVVLHEDTDFRARREEDRLVIAVYNGMFCDALLSPTRPDVTLGIVRDLERIVRAPIWGLPEEEGDGELAAEELLDEMRTDVRD